MWIGRDVQIGAGVRLTGPLVLGDGARVGAGAQLRESILFPGTEVAPGAILIGAIAGHAGSCRACVHSGRQPPPRGVAS